MMSNAALGMTMLCLIVVVIMLGFPTAFTLMGMGMLFTWLAYDRDWHRTLDLMVQAAYKTMANDVLIAVPLFVFMGYLVERANLIESLFKSLHLALARLPGAPRRVFVTHGEPVAADRLRLAIEERHRWPCTVAEQLQAVDL